MPGALPHRLQHHIVWKIQIGRQGNPKGPTGSRKGFYQKWLGPPNNFCKIGFWSGHLFYKRSQKGKKIEKKILNIALQWCCQSTAERRPTVTPTARASIVVVKSSTQPNLCWVGHENDFGYHRPHLPTNSTTDPPRVIRIDIGMARVSSK